MIRIINAFISAVIIAVCMLQCPAEMRYIEEFESHQEIVEDVAQRVSTLYIPSVNIRVGLEEISEIDGGSARKIIGKREIAVLLNYDFLPAPIIADHDYQSFEALKSVKAGDLAYIADGCGNLLVYECLDCGEGKNQRSSLEYGEYDLVKDEIGDLVMYTCDNDDESNSVFIAIWALINTD